MILQNPKNTKLTLYTLCIVVLEPTSLTTSAYVVVRKKKNERVLKMVRSEEMKVRFRCSGFLFSLFWDSCYDLRGSGSY